MIEQATCPHGRKIDDRPTALKNMTKCHCCGMKIAPAYRTLCAQCEDTETMTDTKITITPEEADLLYDQFCHNCCTEMDRPKGLDLGGDGTPTNRGLRYALTLAIARERERCARIAEEHPPDEWACQDMGPDIAKKIRGGE